MAKYNDKRILEMEIRLQAREVQPWLDGFKYEGNKSGIKSIFQLTKEYGSEPKYIKRVKKFFNAIRGRNTTVKKLVDIAETADEESGSYYEQVACFFKGWERGVGHNETNRKINT